MDYRKDYYTILGIEASADSEQVKTAYRTMARRYHPDANPSPEASAQFQEVQEAYDVLSEPGQKRAYDRLREREGLKQPPPLTIKPVLSHQKLAVMDEEQVLYVMVDISPSPTLQTKRLAFNLGLVVDRSTSMQGVRLQRVKDATNYIIDFLDQADVFSLVTFNDRAEVVIPAQSQLDKTLAKSRVSTIRSSGGTEILQGLLAGLGEVDRWRSPAMVNHLILLTDGQTYGGEKECLQEAENAAQRQVSITTMGIGQDWNDKLLDEIARRSGGRSTYIDSAAKVTSVFRECVHSLATVAARGLRLAVRPADNIRLHGAFQVAPYLQSLSIREATMPLGLINAEQVCAVVLEFLVSPQLTGRIPVASLELSADIPSVAQQSTTLRQEIAVELVAGLEAVDPVPPNIVNALGKLAIFRMQEKTMDDLDRGEIEHASQRLETMATRLLNVGENELAKAALLEAGRLARTGHLSPEGRKRIRYGTRSLSMLPKEISHD
jgi:Ca-activated chloride channel family protein